MGKQNIIMGIDGATWEVLDRYMNKDVMPSLGKLIKESCYARLRSTIVPITPSAWASMITGCRPPKTGIFDFLTSVGDGDSYTKKIVNGSDIKVPTMWDILSGYGKEVVSINVPMTFPPRPVHGKIITGMMTPIGETNFTYPAELKSELEAIGITYRIDTELHTNRKKLFTDEEYTARVFANGAEEFFRDLNDLLEIRKRTINHLMNKGDWDYFMFVLIGIDRVQHHLWKYIKDPSLDSKMTTNIEAFYRKVDNFIGEIYNTFKDKANIFMVSDHGFSTLHGTFLVDAWLLKAGHLKLNKSKIKAAKKVVKKLLSVFGVSGKGMVQNIVGKEKAEKIGLSAHNIDWRNTVAYGAETNGININLKGRDTFGIVEQKDYDTIRDEIIRDLLNVTDRNRVKIIKNALKKEEVYKEGKLDHIPDIIMEFHDDNIFQARWSADITEDMDVFVSHDCLTGFHIRDGVLLAAGEDIVKGKELAPLDIEDVLPTMLALNGEKIPEHFDGKVVHEMFTKKIKEAYVKYEHNSGNDEYEYSQSGEDDIREKLKSLGYL